MENFDKLMAELMGEKEQKKTNQFGSRLGERREIVISYAIGDEKESCVSSGSAGDSGKTEDAVAIGAALGRLLGDLLQVDGGEIARDIMKACMRSMAKMLVLKAMEDD